MPLSSWGYSLLSWFGFLYLMCQFQLSEMKKAKFLLSVQHQTCTGFLQKQEQVCWWASWKQEYCLTQPVEKKAFIQQLVTLWIGNMWKFGWICYWLHHRIHLLAPSHLSLGVCSVFLGCGPTSCFKWWFWRVPVALHCSALGCALSCHFCMLRPQALVK